MKQIVRPIKDTNTLQQVQESLLTGSKKCGRRNYTIFQTGKATLLRVSDVLRLRKDNIYDERGRVKRNAYIVDKKTQKRNILYLKPIQIDLEDYYDYLEQSEQDDPSIKVFSSPWLFPSFTRPVKHIDERQYYKIMSNIGKELGINYLGTHTMRKTGAYRVYEQSNHNIALVMKLLNHSSEQMTLEYLGLDQESREHILDMIDFG